jgi:hypothetical protein
MTHDPPPNWDPDWPGAPHDKTADRAHELLAKPALDGSGRARFHAVWDGGKWVVAHAEPVYADQAVQHDWRYVGPLRTIDEAQAPIGDDHRAFAAAVVALAREHGMDGITLTFRRALRLDLPYDPERPRAHEQVKATWARGRHGAAGMIEIRMDACVAIREPGTDR